MHPERCVAGFIPCTFLGCYATLFNDRDCGYPVFGQINHKLAPQQSPEACMVANTIENYLHWISPKLGDPTYSLLKAHLLLEDLLRAYVAKTLPHPQALKDARLTFVQLLAVARSCCLAVSPDHWMWKAIADLNKLRNMLSHEAAPKDLVSKIEDYAKFVATKSKVPFPKSVSSTASSGPYASGQHLFSLADIATLGLYIETASNFGFDVRAFVSAELTREGKVAAALNPSSSRSGAG